MDKRYCTICGKLRQWGKQIGPPKSPQWPYIVNIYLYTGNSTEPVCFGHDEAEQERVPIPEAFYAAFEEEERRKRDGQE